MLKEEVLSSLKIVLGDDGLSTAEDELLNCSVDQYLHFIHQGGKKPDVVVKPTASAQISSIMKIANKMNIPVVPRGAGTGYSGGAVPIDGGIVLDLTRMDKIINIDQEGFMTTVEPGVRVKKLEEELQVKGFTLGHYPGSYSHLTIGGALSTGGTGLMMLRYGLIENSVAGIEAVLPTGEIINTLDVQKSNLGLNLQRLLVGAEGTLGVITKATIRVTPKPEARGAFVFEFDSFDDAYHAALNIFKRGLQAGIYLLEGTSANLALLGITNPNIILFCVLEGLTEEVRVQSEALIQICKRERGKEGGEGVGEAFFKFYLTGLCYLHEKRYAERLQTNATDKCYDLIAEVIVPYNKVPEMCSYIRETNRKMGLGASLDILYFFPAMLILTDANYMFDFTDSAAVSKVKTLETSICGKAIQLGGSVTVSNSTGIRNLSWLPKVYDKDTIQAMNKIKKALDPQNIMNPGKKFLL